MGFYEYYLLAILFLMLLICSYTDIKCGKIKNNLLLSSTLLALPMQIWGCASGVVNKDYFLINFICMVVFALLFYTLEFWAAGDSKLLMSISIIFPYTLYWDIDIYGFKALSLVLVFIAVTYGYVIIDTILNTVMNMDTVLLTLKKTVTKAILISYFEKWVVIVAIAYILNYINKIFLGWSYAYVALTIFLIAMLVGEYLDKLKIVWIVAIVFDIAYWILMYDNVIYVLQVMIIATIIFGLSKMVQVFNYKIIDAQKVKAGMIISILSICAIQDIYKEKILADKQNETMSSRISIEEVDIIRNSGIDRVRIVRKMPFALFVTIASILYIGVRLFYAINYK